MNASAIKRRYRPNPSKRLRQGDIFRDIMVISWDIDESFLTAFEESLLKPREQRILPNPNYDKLVFPYVVVVTQDCDLEHDYNNWTREDPQKQDKIIPSVLVCPAYRVEEFKKGIHLVEITGVRMREIGKNEFEKYIAKCRFNRYHYLVRDAGFEVPDLVLDFKHYFTVPVPVLYMMYNEIHFVASVNEVFREHLSQRFSEFLSRVGLPSGKVIIC
jgi:hypothetical protein